MTIRRIAFVALVLLVACLMVGGGEPDWRAHLGRPTSAAHPAPEEHREPVESFGRRLSLQFIRNDGQWDTTAQFVAERPGGFLRVEPGRLGIRLEQRGDDERRVCLVDFVFEGANPDVRLVGEGRTVTQRHYFLGADPDRWKRHVPSFASVRYRGLYDGIDLALYEGKGAVEYDVLLDPGADLTDFVVRCDGADGLRIDRLGRLIVETPVGEVVQDRPEVWQVTASGGREVVDCRYELLDDLRYGFVIPGGWDHGRPLVIDPGVTWGTYLGGNSDERPFVVRRLESGEVVVAGSTLSSNFPTTPGVYSETSIVPTDATISILSADGSALLVSTYFGGSDVEAVEALDVDSAGNFAITGGTRSADCPVTADAFQTAYGGGITDTYVALFDPTCSSLLYSTFIGGGETDTSSFIFAEESGRLTVAGYTRSPTFPSTLGTYDPTFNGVSDGFLLSFDPTQTGNAQLAWSTFLGGAASDLVKTAARMPSGDIVIVGETFSTDFPTTPGALDEKIAGSMGDFVSRLSADGATLVASTIFEPQVRALNVEGDAVVLGGRASGLPYPLPPVTFNPGPAIFADAFLVGLDEDLSALDWYGYMGGSGGAQDRISAIAIDSDGIVMAAGVTSSSDFPVTPGAHDTDYSFGCGDVFVMSVSADKTELLYSSFLGDSTFVCNAAYGIIADGPGAAIVVGTTGAGPFPVTPGAFDTTWNGGLFGDTFVVRMPVVPPWSDLGVGIPGSMGTPKLVGEGTLCGGEDIKLKLTRALPGAAATLVLGVSTLEVPFKGGVLVPSPDVLITGLPVNGAGALTLVDTWPTGLPAGVQIVLQYWIPDPVGPQGLTSSNGLVGTTP